MNARLQQMNTLLSKEIKIKTKEHLNDEIFKHVELKNNRYVLNLSKEKCQQMGISPLEYQRLIVDLEKVNKLIVEVGNNSKEGIELVHPKQIHLANRTKGQMFASDMTEVKEKIFIPDGYKTVRFSGAIPKVAWLTALVCGVSIEGGAFKLESLAGSIFVTRTYDMPLSLNNCNAELYFQAGDPYGGSIWWELIK